MPIADPPGDKGMAIVNEHIQPTEAQGSEPERRASCCNTKIPR
jgi:hypothetical protein